MQKEERKDESRREEKQNTDDTALPAAPAPFTPPPRSQPKRPLNAPFPRRPVTARQGPQSNINAPAPTLPSAAAQPAAAAPPTASAPLPVPVPPSIIVPPQPHPEQQTAVPSATAVSATPASALSSDIPSLTSAPTSATSSTLTSGIGSGRTAAPPYSGPGPGPLSSIDERSTSSLSVDPRSSLTLRYFRSRGGRAPPVRWERIDVKDLENVLDTDLKNGLAQEEAKARIGKYGPNELERSRRPALWRLFLANWANPILLLLTLSGLVSLALQEWPEGIAILVIVLIDVTLYTYTEKSSGDALQVRKIG